MQFKKHTKRRNDSIQGLRSLKDTLPKNVKKVISKRGLIYSEILNNWKYIVGDNLFKICYPKSYKNSNKFRESSLLIMVKRGHEVDLEYSKKKIIDKLNSFFNSTVVKKIKFASFNIESEINNEESKINQNVTNNNYVKIINNVKNNKIKKSLLKLSGVFKKR